jgi:hypothetical protein
MHISRRRPACLAAARPCGAGSSSAVRACAPTTSSSASCAPAPHRPGGGPVPPRPAPEEDARARTGERGRRGRELAGSTCGRRRRFHSELGRQKRASRERMRHARVHEGALGSGRFSGAGNFSILGNISFYKTL